jgi:hypothetical protein
MDIDVYYGVVFTENLYFEHNTTRTKIYIDKKEVIKEIVKVILKEVLFQYNRRSRDDQPIFVYNYCSTHSNKFLLEQFASFSNITIADEDLLVHETDYHKLDECIEHFYNIISKYITTYCILLKFVEWVNDLFSEYDPADIHASIYKQNLLTNQVFQMTPDGQQLID